MKFPFYKQHDQMDCGPTCLRMISKQFGKHYSIQYLRELSGISKIGVSLLGISEAAEKIGFRTLAARIELSQLKDAQLPCVLHWRQRHFVVLYEIKKNKYFIADPARGLITYNESEFIANWLSKNKLKEGIALFVAPTPQFYQEEGQKSTGINFSFLLKYRYAYRGLIFQLFLGLACGSVLQFIAPFLTQSLVDIGIGSRNIGFIYTIFIAQVMLFVVSMSIGFLRSWIMLHLTTRINVSILTDFLAKLMRLPISFFDSKKTGDIMQRMSDHRRVEAFLTGTTLNTLFSIINLIVYTFVIAYFNVKILFIFLVSTCLYTGWIFIFMRPRRELDQKRFDNSSYYQSNMIELISGINDIKLHTCEQQKRWKWEGIQATLFKYSIKGLTLSQYQQAGASFINQGKNILINFICAKSVIDGDLTMGGMMALLYLAGQLNSPIEQLLGLIQGYQDAKISLERLNEVHGMEDEESKEKQWIYSLPDDKSISINHITFRYPGAGNEPVLNDVTFNIPQGKTTAIVGMSGSGKTTILKLLLRYYRPEKGEIKVGGISLDSISFKEWRRKCGIVTQEGFVFSDTIAGNISVGEEYPDKKKLLHAISVANIKDFIEELPLGLNTMIGAGGNGISQGQKQRMFIARAVYKDPEFIFFDEATNSLDANNERIILDNLNEFFAGKTVVVVAHRLSTVKNADNIIVIEKGLIIEQGTHKELIALKGKYFDLVRNQLELGE